MANELTDDQLNARAGAPAAPAATPRPRSTAPAVKAAPTTKDVPLTQAQYKQTVDLQNDVGALRNAIGLDIDDATGAVTLDNNKSKLVTEGADPDVSENVTKRWAREARIEKAAVGGGEMSKFIQSDSGADPYEQFNGGWFQGASPSRREQARNLWVAAQKAIGPEGKKAGEDPSIYFANKMGSEKEKAGARDRLAKKFEDAASLMPVQSGGAQTAQNWRQIAQFIRTQDRSLLSPQHRSMAVVSDLAGHASKPVEKAVAQAVTEHSDPERTGIFDALKTGFGNNVAPMTMGLGSMIAQGIKGDGEVHPPGGDIITRDPKTGFETTTRGAPDPGAGQTGRDVDLMHQTIVQALTGKPPGEQAAYIERLKYDHPKAYALGAGLGWFADPLGGALVKGGRAVARGVEALGAAPAVAKGAGMVAAGAPAGVISGRAAGSDADIKNAALGVAAEGAGALIGKAGGAVVRKLGGAPVRIEQSALNAEARAAAHEVGKAEFRAGTKDAAVSDWYKVYSRLEGAHPELLEQGPNMFEAGPGGSRVHKQLAEAADLAVHEAKGRAGGASATQQAIRPNVVLMNEAVPASAKVGPLAHAVALHGPVRAGAMAVIGAKHNLAHAVDQTIAPLVTAIRSGVPETFRAAVREAAAAGVPAATINAAEEAFARRQRVAQ